jgi:long-chain acyl-CoA synthetase
MANEGRTAGPRDGAVLLTGATGFVGSQVLARYLEGSSRRVYALVRPGDEADASGRLQSTIAATFGRDHPYTGRVEAVAADLERPGMGLDPQRAESLAGEIGDIVHCAASVSLSMSLDDSRRVNVGGTAAVLELAGRCHQRGGLRCLTYVSTTFVSGTFSGAFGEDDLDVGQQFRNGYEQSKYEAEKLVRESGLPAQVVRPSIVVGERESGWTSSFNVLYYPIKLFAKGASPPIVPARRDTPLDAVPVDYVADAIFELSHGSPEPGRTFHLVAGSEASTLGDILEAVAGHFGGRVPWMMPVRLYMALLDPIVIRVYRGRRRRALKLARSFVPYFSMKVSFADDHARRRLAAAGIRGARLESYLPRLLDFATAANWGKVPIGRAEARAMAAGVARTDGSVSSPGHATAETAR